MRQILVNGRRIGYEVRPETLDEAALTLVMIHGSGGHKADWGAQLEGLSNGHAVVALDLPGHGDSDPPGEQNVAAYAEWVTGFVEALGLSRVMLVGCSLGSATALWLALHPRPWLRAVGLVGAGARLKVHPAFLDGFLKDSQAAIGMLVEYALFQGSTDSLRQTIRSQFLGCPVELLHGDFTACNEFDVMERVGSVELPTWIVVGAEDRLTPPKYSAFLHDRIPGSRLDMIPGAGHLVMIEKPDAFNSLLRGFLATLPGPSHAP
ncbi:MAG: alpha/beta hydrolase [Thermodesulfobacteriota bacterium]